MSPKKGKLCLLELRATSFMTSSINPLNQKQQREIVAGSAACGTAIYGTVETCRNDPVSAMC